MPDIERGEAAEGQAFLRGEPFLKAVEREVARARAAWPRNAHMYAALAEEVGEVARALLEGQGPDALRAECVQVAAMAMRLAEEGDADFDPEEQ